MYECVCTNIYTFYIMLHVPVGMPIPSHLMMGCFFLLIFFSILENSMQCVLIIFTTTSSPHNSSQIHFHLPTPFQLHVFFLFNKPLSLICVFCTPPGGRAIHWSVVYRPGAMPLRKTDFPSPEPSFSAGGGAHESLPTVGWDVDWLGPVQAC